MKRTAITAGTLALLASALTPLPAIAQDEKRNDEDKKDNTAAIVAGIAALGIGIAIATSGKDKDKNQWDGDRYGDPFSPARYVECFPRQRTCYERGHYSYSWTQRIFGSGSGWGGSGGSWGGSGGGGWGGSGGSWGNGDLDRARRVCVDRAEDRGLRNINVESSQPHDSKRARVYLQARRSPATVNYERWRCEYTYSSGRTDFKKV
ncbi:hypothetical protein [Porphyrobacter sp. CACIAM 03H1]|uniref:hypothetical protein n=1 Tax=Porphyrobacter sp. CACIAM 03H1 TaxID=2003315 RepID=UPI000B5A2789|nr:hypothetical protein [Porphyrobacter sp. CACIAM 03H1]ASJ90356.1 hypothetical protein CBR61_05080 [Porphyrobacter sp. CACIAM 03H1]